MAPLPSELRISPSCPYHVTIAYMRYSVPYELAGEGVDVKVAESRVEVMHDSSKAASHPRLRGRKGRYSTDASHMPDGHREQLPPWSRERFSSWADRIGPETGAAVRRLMAARPVVEQPFVACRNIPGLAKRYSPQLLESACARTNAAGAVPSYTACKNAILAEKAAAGRPVPAPAARGGLVDNAKSAGRLRRADAYRRDGR